MENDELSPPANYGLLRRMGKPQPQQSLIEYLKTENEIYREQLGSKRIRFTDDQRRRLAVKAKVLGHKALSGMDCIVTPDTLFRWYRNLIAQKYDGSRNRGPGRPRSNEDISDLIVRMAKENRSWGYTCCPH